MFVQGQYGILSVNWLRRQLTGSDGETDRQQGRRGKGMGEVGRGEVGKWQDPPAADVYRSCQVGDGV